MTNKQGLDLYNDVMTTSMILSLLILPFVGFFSDKSPGDIQIVFVFGLRMTAAASFFLLENPNNFVAYVIPILIAIFTNLENVTVNAMLAKKLPGDIRGTLTAAVSSLSSLGKVCFNSICIKAIRAYGIQAPFFVIAVMDGIMIFITILMAFYGAFEKEYPKSDKEKALIKEIKEKKAFHEAEKKLKKELEKDIKELKKEKE